MKGGKRQREEDREEETKDKTEKERREGGREEKEGKKKKKEPFLSQSSLSPLPLRAGRYALHFKTHLGLQGRKQLASSNLSRLSILGDNEGQVLKGK